MQVFLISTRRPNAQDRASHRRKRLHRLATARRTGRPLRPAHARRACRGSCGLPGARRRSRRPNRPRAVALRISFRRRGHRGAPRLQALRHRRRARHRCLRRGTRERAHGGERLPHGLRGRRPARGHGEFQPRRRLVRARAHSRAQQRDGVSGRTAPVRQLLRLGQGVLRTARLSVRLRHLRAQARGRADP